MHRYAGARPHNPREVVEEAGAFVDAHACRCVVAIGSSSAIDLGKAVADGRDVVLALVPSALGGAEMSRGYGVLEGDRKTGGRLRSPAPIVVYDAALLASLAARELGSIGINGWAHTIEAHYARTQHALGTAAAVEAGRRLPPLLKRGAAQRDDALHRALFEQAHLAGFALDTRSMGLHHAVCHVIGGLTQIPHGIVNAIVLPHAVRANAHLAPDAVDAVAQAFGHSRPRGGSRSDRRGLRAAAHVRGTRRAARSPGASAAAHHGAPPARQQSRAAGRSDGRRSAARRLCG